MNTETPNFFLTNRAISLLKNLRADTLPNFGLMTAQHMVEHLIYTTKSSIKDYGAAPMEPTKGQLGFRKFINNGAKLEHYPSDKTVEDLPKLRFGSLEEAIDNIPTAVQRFYDHFSNNKKAICFNPMMGELNFEELELFHEQHYRYHFWQFGLLENY